MHACMKYLYHVHPFPVYTNISLSCGHRYVLMLSIMHKSRYYIKCINMKQTKCIWIPFLGYYIYYTVIVITEYYFIIQLFC